MEDKEEVWNIKTTITVINIYYFYKNKSNRNIDNKGDNEDNRIRLRTTRLRGKQKVKNDTKKRIKSKIKSTRKGKQNTEINMKVQEIAYNNWRK